MLIFDRKQQNFVKQLSFIKKLIKRKRICPSGDKKLTPLKNRILERMVILPKISQSKKKKKPPFNVAFVSCTENCHI